MQETGSGPQGWSSIPRWLLYAEDVSGHAKLVYVVIQSYTDDTGRSYPNNRLLAKRTGWSVATVKRAKAELVTLGVIDTEERRRADGGRGSNRYTVRTTRPVENPGDNPTPGSQ